jgi:hypothetical protein
MTLTDLLEGGIVTNRRLSQYHDDSNHDSNWCEVCGYYYCWHIESPVALWNRYSHFRSAWDHKFVPSKWKSSARKAMELKLWEKQRDEHFKKKLEGLKK